MWLLRLLPSRRVTNTHRPDQSTTGCYGNTVYKMKFEAKLCRILQLTLIIKNSFCAFLARVKTCTHTKNLTCTLLVLIWERLQMPMLPMTTTTTMPDATVQSLGWCIANENSSNTDAREMFNMVVHTTIHSSLLLKAYCCCCCCCWVSRYQKKHSATHTHPDHQSSFVCFLHLLRSMASSIFNLYAWQFFAQSLSKFFLVCLLV